MDRVGRVGFIYDAIYPFVRGGVERRIWEIATRLTRQGVEVHLFGVKFWNGSDMLTRDGVVIHGVTRRVAFYTPAGRRSIWQAILFAVHAAWEVRRHDLDLIDCQGEVPLACLASSLAARLEHVPLVITWHEVRGRYWLEYMGPLGHVARLIELMCGKVTRHHLAVSRHTARRLRSVGVSDVCVVPNGVDMALIDETTGNSHGSEITLVGRLVREKNVDLLLDAVVELRQRGLDPTVLIVGDGPERARLEERAADLKLDKVRFATGWESERQVIQALKGSRILALPSTHEGFSLAALEAAACGLPVVTVSAPGNAATEVVGAGGLVTANDPSAFADALEKLLTNESAWQAMSSAARQQAASWDWDTPIDELRNLYSRVIASSKR